MLDRLLNWFGAERKKYHLRRALQSIRLKLTSVVIDPRSYWVTVVPTQATSGYRLTGYVYEDETQSGGNHNLYVTVVDKNGAPLSGVMVHQAWPDGDVAQPALGGVTNFGLYGGPFYPDQNQTGAYYCYIEGKNHSDIVTGMGLPVNRHVNYILTFQQFDSSTPAPVPTPAPTGDYPTNAQWASAFNQASTALANIAKIFGLS